MRDTRLLAGQKIRVAEFRHESDRCTMNHVCNGYVIRYTRHHIIVENEHGNEMRFRRDNHRRIGNASQILFLVMANEIVEHPNDGI